MFLKISDAANLGIHALSYLARHYGEGRPIATAEAAEAFGVSPNHLSKVLQRLARVGLVRSIRGPKGGFLLAKPPEEITLQSIYEAIDGQMAPHGTCLLGSKACGQEHCVFGTLVDDVQRRVYEQFANVTLDQVS